MVFVDNAVIKVRDYLTTLSSFLSIGTSTTQSISLTTVQMDSKITSVSLLTLSYPSVKKYTAEYLINSLESNGFIFKQVGIAEISTTSNVITISDIPALEKNKLIEASFEITMEVING